MITWYYRHYPKVNPANIIVDVLLVLSVLSKNAPPLNLIKKGDPNIHVYKMYNKYIVITRPNADTNPLSVHIPLPSATGLR